MWTTAIAEVVPHRAHPRPRGFDARHISRIRATSGASAKVDAPERETPIHNIVVWLATCEHAEETMKTWLTVAEGAAYAGVSRDTIYTACERGELSHARIGGRRSIRLKPAWIDVWLERHTRNAQDGRAAEQISMHGGVS
jgi:excisionase family DNA binding protein